jgi:hypothetical protein
MRSGGSGEGREAFLRMPQGGRQERGLATTASRLAAHPRHAIAMSKSPPRHAPPPTLRRSPRKDAAMASRRFSRFRHALRLVASVFLLSTPCQGGEDPVQAESAVARTVPGGPAADPARGPPIFAGASHPVR